MRVDPREPPRAALHTVIRGAEQSPWHPVNVEGLLLKRTPDPAVNK